MRIRIQDDFDMKKIRISGQCFRVKELEGGVFRFITGKNVVYIRKIEDEKGLLYNEEIYPGKTKGVGAFYEGEDRSAEETTVTSLEVSCTKEEWENIWASYFDLGRNYAQIADTEYGKHHFADSAISFGRGLRILKQDKWEMLVTFIISQRKSIPAISSAVEALCRKFGEKIEIDKQAILQSIGLNPQTNAYEAHESNPGKSVNGEVDGLNTEIAGLGEECIYSFPLPQQLAMATAEDFKECGLGYRAPYVRDAVEKVCSGELDLEAIDSLGDEELFEKLMTVHGVGKKVANCVLLFGYSRTARVPIDVWIQRAIEQECDGVDPFPLYGVNGGIIQQYVFFFQKNAPKRVFPMTCPCCGKAQIDEPHGICPECGWEDDKLQNLDENLADGANGISLKEYRKKIQSKNR